MKNPQPEVESGEDGVVDSHCHLFLIDEDPGAVLAHARERGVDRVICCGIDPESSRRSREIADAVAGVFATAGVHPHDASRFDAAAGSVIEELLADPRVVGVGETGLDYHRMRSPAEDQRRAFRAHCALARETGKALVVHCREAWEDVLRILADERVDRVVLHCFSGDAATAAEAAARGYHCSFAGNISYPTNESLRLAASEVPAGLLLVETDSPFLTPQALRGKDNSPGNAPLVVEALAEARGEPLTEVAAQTAGNASAVFGLPH